MPSTKDQQYLKKLATFTLRADEVLNAKIASDGSSPAAIERLRYIHIIQALIELFDGMDAPDETTDKLRFFMAALLDLDQGKVSPILKPKKLRGSPPESTVVWLARANLAMAVECLVQGGAFDVAQAVDEVVKQCSGAEFDTILRNNNHKGKATIASSLANWRDDLKQGRAAISDIAQSQWKDFTTDLSEFDILVRSQILVFPGAVSDVLAKQDFQRARSSAHIASAGRFCRLIALTHERPA